MDNQPILEFWFVQCTPKMWFNKNREFDDLIKEKFINTIEVCMKTEINDFFLSLETYLSSIIVLDQFTRNIFRNTDKAYQGDKKAIQLSSIAIQSNFLKEKNYHKNSFLLMPLMHSENIQDHELGLPYFQEYTNSNTFKYALKHKEIIERFGRFPHRNKILGRNSTQSELEFLKLPGSRF
jgi:uncharacterized protein (DUF924 family)